MHDSSAPSPAEVIAATVAQAQASAATADNAANPAAPAIDSAAPVAASAQYEPPARLTVPREQAMLEVRAALKIGQGIYSQRIRNRWELDMARQEKQEWTQRTTDLLLQLFGGDTRAADSCNDWVSQILPEYAELELFIEQFENEMKHRIARVKSVLKSLDTAPVSAAVAAAEAAAAAAAEEQQRAAARQQAPVQTVPPASIAPESAAAALLLAKAPRESAADANAAFVSQGPAQPAPAAIAPPAEASSAAPASPSPTPTSAAARSPAAAASAPSPTPAAEDPDADHSRGILVALSDHEPARTATQQFARSLGLTLYAIARDGAEEYFVHPPSGAPRPAFAVVLVEPEDLGGRAASAGAQGYHFALGCCVGQVGAIRTIVLVRSAEHAGAPVALHGVPHLSMDGGGAWQLAVARELKKSGVPVDLNRLV